MKTGKTVAIAVVVLCVLAAVAVGGWYFLGQGPRGPYDGTYTNVTFSANVPGAGPITMRAQTTTIRNGRGTITISAGSTSMQHPVRFVGTRVELPTLENGTATVANGVVTIRLPRGTVIRMAP